MSRSARKDIKSEYIHLITQGICKEYIFQDDENKREYLKLIDSKLKEYHDLKLLAYCIMDNHSHLLVHIENIESLSKVMSKINTSYAIYYNKQKNRIGYVFRNRYYTQPISSRKQLYNTVVYIHRNPVKAGIVEKMSDYINSSYCSFESGKINIEIPELIFGTKKYIDIFNYIHRNFIDEEIYDVKEDNEDVNNKKIKQLIIDFCKENNTQLEDIREDNKSILKLVNIAKQTLNLSEKKIAESIGIGKNRITNIKKKLKV